MSGVILEPHEPHDGGAIAHDVESRPAHRTRTTRLAVAGVAAALVAAVVFVGRDRGGSFAPPTTVPRTTVAPTPTSANRPPPGSTGFTEQQTFLSFVSAPTHTVLYAVTDTGNVSRIDLDAGSISQRRLRNARSDSPVRVFGAAGAAVVASNGQTVAVHDGATGLVARFDSGATAFPAATAGELWLVEPLGGGRLQVERRRADGTPVGVMLTVDGGSVLGDDGTGALLVRMTDGVYRYTDDGAHPALFSADPVVAWTAASVVVEACNDGAHCTWRAVDRASGGQRVLGPAPASGRVLGGELSADGTHLAYVTGIGGPNRPSLEVLDVTSGARTVIDHTAALVPAQGSWQGLVWSADGQWLFWLTDDGTLRAWQATTGATATIDGAGHIPALQAIGLA